MTLDEAIKKNKATVSIRPSKVLSWEERQSIQLGIEALEWIKWRRENYKMPPILPLPSETEGVKE